MVFDKKRSHILDKADEKATGTTAFTEDHEGSGKPIPRKVTGAVHLLKGQDIKDVPHDASACEIAHKITRDEEIEAGAAYSVPDFMIVSEDYTLDASSGIALAMKARPLKKDREYRVEINQPFIRRIFSIEQAWLGFKDTEDDALVQVIQECTQTWDAGELTLPENKKEKSEWLLSMLDKGVIDIIEVIKQLEQFPSDTEAIAFYKTMKERENEYPPLNANQPPEPPPSKPVGLLRRQRAREQQSSNEPR